MDRMKPAGGTKTTAGGPRARYREQTRAEIKDIALRQLTEGGIPAIPLTRIAKELELSGPALYRYFASRDDLLGSLIGDAYEGLAVTVGEAAEESAKYTLRHRLLSLAGTYRTWAVQQRHRYLLIAGSPLPGYTAPPETLVHARAALGPFLEVFESAQPGPVVLPNGSNCAPRKAGSASNSLEAKPLSAITSRLGRSVAKCGSRSSIADSTSRSSSFGFGSAHRMGIQVGVHTWNRRRPQKNREREAQYPYPAQPAMSVRFIGGRERPHSTGV